MHIPAHPVWFWLIITGSFLASLLVWIAARTLTISLKPLEPWLWVAYAVFAITWLGMGLTGSNRLEQAVAGVIAWSCYSMAFVIRRRYMFESLPPPGSKWYLPWRSAEFSIPGNARILVKDINSVSRWYSDKLGLLKLATGPKSEPGTATLKFKADGKAVVLTTRSDFRTGKTPIFFTRKINRVRGVMAARGIDVGEIEADRQGIRYFQIHDPEGNEIEIVEER